MSGEARRQIELGCVRARDKADFLNLYTEDAVLMIPNLDALEGHAGAARFFEAFENRELLR
jgi:ketosteroid isomerase-like protein